MSGLLTSIFSVGSHSGAQTDRSNTLQGYGDLKSLFNFGMGQGASSLAKGNQTEASALGQLSGPDKYFSSLLSGNRAATLSAAAPVVNAATAQTDAQKAALGTGTGRGGGVNAAKQSLDTNKNATIDDAINKDKTSAAAGETGVASATSSVGNSQLQTAMSLLGLGQKSAQDLTADASGNRELSNALHEQQAQQYSQIATAGLDVLLGGGGASGIASRAQGLLPQ